MNLDTFARYNTAVSIKEQKKIVASKISYEISHVLIVFNHK